MRGNKKRAFSAFISLILVAAMVPEVVFAEESENVKCEIIEGRILPDGHESDCETLDKEPTASEKINSDMRKLIDNADEMGAEELKTAAEVILEAADRLDDEDFAKIDKDLISQTEELIDKKIRTFTSEKSAKMSGHCGEEGDEESVGWRLRENRDNTYTLTIFGDGKMADYKNPTAKTTEENECTPWYLALKDSANEENKAIPITEIIIDGDITYLGAYSFAFTDVKSAEFKSSVVDFGEGVYYSCPYLTTVDWTDFNPKNVDDDWVTERDERGAFVPFSLFDQCEALDTCIIDGIQYDKGVLVLPKNVKGVLTAAFRKTDFSNVDFNDGLKNIRIVGPYAFAYLKNLKSVTIPGGVEFYGQNDNGNANTFLGGGLETVVFADDVTHIDGGIFSSTASLERVVIDRENSKLASIGKMAFYNCTSLDSFIFPDALMEIKDSAFLGTALESVEIGRLQTMEGGVFVNCENLKNVKIEGTQDLVIPANTFGTWGEGYPAAAPLEYFELGAGECEVALNQKKDTLEEVVLGDGIKNIKNYYLYGCGKVTKISLGNGIETIGAYAFSQTSISEIVIPDSVTEIGEGAFSSCTSLTSVKISPQSKLTKMGGYTGAKITNIYIPSGITQIESGSFFNLSDLTVVDMSSLSNQNVKIGAWCFTSWWQDITEEDRPLRIYYVNNAGIIDRLKNTDNCNEGIAENEKDTRIDLSIIAVTNGGVFKEGTKLDTNTLKNPIKAGYVFDGWYTDEEFKNKVADSYTLAKGQTYYAKWEKSGYSATANIEFDALIYGQTPSSKDVEFTYNGGDTGSIKSVDSGSYNFTAQYNGLTVTITPKKGLTAGNYVGTVTVTTGDDAVHAIGVSLTVGKTDSETIPENNTISATYGEKIIFTAETKKAEVSPLSMATQDEVDFYCGDTFIGSAKVKYTGDSGTASLIYDTIDKKILIGESVVKAYYGGSINLNGSESDEIAVNLSQKELTVAGVTAIDKKYDGDDRVELNGGELSEAIFRDDVALDTSGAYGTAASYKAGMHNVTVNGFTIIGNDAGYYTLKQPDYVTVKITKEKNSSGGYSLSEGRTERTEDDESSRNGKIFVDLNEDHPYYNGIMKAVKNGWMTGTSEITFGPDGYMTRAMACQILYNKAGSPEILDVSTFLDVTSDKWYAKAVSWCEQQGIVIGYGNGYFGPEDFLTEEQLGVMLGFDSNVKAGATRGLVAQKITE